MSTYPPNTALPIYGAYTQTSAQAADLEGRLALLGATNVRDLAYGAKGDGATDDATAIQNAVNVGGTVVIPWTAAGYRITREITVGSNTTLLIYGSVTQATSGLGVFVATGQSGISLQTYGPAVLNGYSSTYNAGTAHGVVTCTNCTDVTIRVRVRNAESYGILLTDCVRFLVDGSSVRDFGYAGIMALADTANSGCEQGRITHCHVKNCTRTDAPSSYGIALGCLNAAVNMDHRYILIDGNQVEDVPRWNGLDVHGGQHVTFLNNTVKNVRRGLEAVIGYTNTSTPHLSDIKIVGNTFVGVSSDVGGQPEFGINIGGARNGTTDYTGVRFQVAHNHVEGFNKYYAGGALGGICFTNLDQFTITDNTCYDNGQNGIVGVLQATASVTSNGAIRGNIVTKQAGTTGPYALSLQPAGADNQYQDITITDNRLTGYQYAVYALSLVQNGLFAQNDVTGTGTGAINGTPSNLGTTRDNVGYKTRAYGVTSAAATPITVSHGLATTPTRVTVTAATSGAPSGIPYVSGITSTQFVINFSGGSTSNFYWEAEV